MSNIPTDSIMAFVLLKSTGEHPAAPDITALTQKLSEKWPGLPALRDIESDEGINYFSIADEIESFISVENERFDAEDLDAASDNSWWWDMAPTAVEIHNSYIVVNLAGSEEEYALRYKRLTFLVAALCEISPSVAVFWPSCGTLRSPDEFIAIASEHQYDSEDIPLRLWTDFQVFESEDLMNLYSTGLEALGYPEVEIQESAAPAEELLDIAYTVAEYMVRTNSLFEDDELLELPDGDRIKITYAPSVCGHDSTVLSLEMKKRSFTIFS
jgi:hypothetical protein